MNKASSKRLISKQEASVLLGGLDLFVCTETIESVSISNSKAMRQKEDQATNKTFLEQYAKREDRYQNISLYDYFLITKTPSKSKKGIIPHFVGISGNPTYPVTENYARHILTVYQPWTKYPVDRNWVAEFESFIKSSDAPPSAKMHYERIMCRHFDHTTHYDPTSTDIDHTGNPITSEDKQLIDLLGLRASDNIDYDTALLKSIEKGENFKWDKNPKVCFFLIFSNTENFGS